MLLAAIAFLLGWLIVVGRSSTPAVSVTVADLTDDPAAYAGLTVTVSGRIETVLDAHGLSIGGEEFVGGRLLAVSEEPLRGLAGVGKANLGSLAGGVAQVTGEARVFDLDRAEQELGVELDERAYEGRDGAAMVLARQIVLTPRIADAAAPPIEVELDELLSDFRALNGQAVIVTAHVRKVIDPRAFAIGGEARDRRLLVVGAEGDLPDLSPGQRPRIVGTVLILSPPFYSLENVPEGLLPDSAFPEGYFTNEAFDPFRGGPLIVATDISPTDTGP